MHQTSGLVYDAGEGQKRLRKTLADLQICLDYNILGARCQIFRTARDNAGGLFSFARLYKRDDAEHKHD